MSNNHRTMNYESLLIGAAIVLILVTGLIHLVTAPDNFSDATYKGIMFVLNAGAAAVAAFGIYRGSKSWGWSLGLIVAAGSIVMYIISRTIGLPGLDVDSEWLEPIGVLSVVVEGLFIVVSYLYLTNRVSVPTLQAER